MRYNVFRSLTQPSFVAKAVVVLTRMSVRTNNFEYKYTAITIRLINVKYTYNIKIKAQICQ